MAPPPPPEPTFGALADAMPEELKQQVLDAQKQEAEAKKAEADKAAAEAVESTDSPDDAETEA